MKNKKLLLFTLPLIIAKFITAQVPVREEPMHHPVLQNKYVRLLDVWIPPGDTSLFHIHATPSLFIILSNTYTGSQIEGAAWVADTSVAGTAWYRSFSSAALVHRVCNADKTPYHVNDIELLSPYGPDRQSPLKPLAFPLLFENEKAFAYKLTRVDISNQIIKNRGPMIAELVAGDDVILHNSASKQSKNIKAGKYLYIDARTSFYFSLKGRSPVKMILFEIK